MSIRLTADDIKADNILEKKMADTLRVNNYGRLQCRLSRYFGSENGEVHVCGSRSDSFLLSSMIRVKTVRLHLEKHQLYRSKSAADDTSSCFFPCGERVNFDFNSPVPIWFTWH